MDKFLNPSGLESLRSGTGPCLLWPVLSNNGMDLALLLVPKESLSPKALAQAVTLADPAHSSIMKGFLVISAWCGSGGKIVCTQF